MKGWVEVQGQVNGKVIELIESINADEGCGLMSRNTLKLSSELHGLMLMLHKLLPSPEQILIATPEGAS